MVIASKPSLDIELLQRLISQLFHQLVPVSRQLDSRGGAAAAGHRLHLVAGRIAGMPDHIHLFVSLLATLAMSKFVQELKVATSKWLKENPHFPLFDRWSKEYAGFSYNLRDKDMIVGYIAKQKKHHQHKTFAQEYWAFLLENGVEIKEEYFLKD